MKKPLWLRLLGWFDLALWLWCGLVLLTGMTHATVLIPAIWNTYLFTPAALTLFCVWAIVSGIVWSANKNARTQAAVTREVVERVLSERGPRVELPTARTGIVCARCKGYASVLYCNHHSESLCWRCAVTTDSSKCAYILANRAQEAAVRRHRQPMATSPLTGIR